jgi:hypothetical protein
VAANKLVWDARMFELYGIREQDFSGAYDAWQAGLHPEDRARGDAAITAAIDGVKDFTHQSVSKTTFLLYPAAIGDIAAA